ncbi:MAG: glycosyltransferase [Butyrivibrio sp.]|nr:glycosyltransferase [Butyrivibrio sp.]
MKILFLNWNGYGNEDLIDAFKKMGEEGKDITLLVHDFDAHTKRDDAEFIASFGETLRKDTPDMAFSYNYFPAVSVACQKEGVRYVSWVYDNPTVALFSYTLINSCNCVFLFDSKMYETFASQGIKTVHYLPLAAPVERYDSIKLSDEDYVKWGGKVSFVGGLYNDRGNFYDRIKDKISDRSRGYLEGIMRSQMEIDGLDIVESSLTAPVLEDMVKALDLHPNSDGVESYEYLYSNYVLHRKITSVERREILEMTGAEYPVNLYTNDSSFAAAGVDNRGLIDYYNEMPKVFKASDINLNITLRSIQKGIPLRALDIMACGGFLLTNYQEDMFRFFTPGEDFVYYESRQDLMEKIGYYLEHEDERMRISQSALSRMRSEHTIRQRLEQILDIAGRA